MPQNCSNKVISLHFHKCREGHCPNSKVCYHINKTKLDFTKYGITGTDLVRRALLNQGYKVHESVCTTGTLEYYISLLNLYKNYNITISKKDFQTSNLEEFYNQIQVTIYDIEDAIAFKNYQKLFLIKDDLSLDIGIALLKTLDLGRIHIIIEQSYLESNARILTYLIHANEKKFNKQASLDTCLTSWVVNGCCPYVTNYIDITYDATVRKCPYQKDGYLIQGVEDSFQNTPVRTDCIYYKLFQRKDDERFVGTNIQDSTTNNGSGGCTKHRRRFSLRS